MFNNLQVESKLDIFKYLNIEQLTSFRQTNRYFNALIGRYEGELARKELDSIEIIEFYHGIYYKSINLQDGLFELKITDQLMEKWHSAVDKQIPLYLNITSKSQKVIIIYKDHNDSQFLLNLQLIPKNIEEVKIIRCWIERISLAYFNDFNFLDFILNPKLIQLLFENEENFQFNCKSFRYFGIINENVLLFYLNRLVISELFLVNLSSIDDTFKQQSINILFKFLLKIPKVYIDGSKHSTICKMILNHIESSKDYSNMFNYIRFSNCSWPSFNLNERAEFIERRPGFSHYQLTNMHNPKIKFSIFYEERNGLIFNFNIARVNQ
ncbi:hypothetical protein ACQ4LE_006581 [Meloidogyne hapla]